MTGNHLLLGTRGSELALTQTRTVAALLRAQHAFLELPHKVIQTTGDKRTDLKLSDFAAAGIVDKGVFIKELETALESQQIDAAVHSLKDMPSELDSQFAIPAVLERAPIEDLLISAAGYTLQTLPPGARIGTSSVRRARQLQWLRPDVNVVDLRGNVPTRLRKCLGAEPLDAILLAVAGVLRLGLFDAATGLLTIDEQQLTGVPLPTDRFYPAAAQGAIAIETRARDSRVVEYVRTLNHAPTMARISAEREFLRLLGAGCQTPVGVHTELRGTRLHMAVRVFSETVPSAAPREARGEADIDAPFTLAKRLARDVTDR
jgi:hydroxymethylbilane synthase